MIAWLRATRRRRPVELVLAVLVLATLLPLWTCAHLPTQDGPSHLYMAQAAVAVSQGQSPWVDLYERRPEVVPNLLAATALTQMVRTTPPHLAERLLFSIYLVAFCWAFGALARGERERMPPVALLAPAFAWSFPFAMGFTSYALGTAIALGTWALAWRGRTGRGWVTPAGVFLLTCLALLAHAVAGGLVILGVAVVALASPSSRRGRLLAPLVLPAVWLGVWWSTRPASEGAESLPWLERLGVVFGLRGLVSVPGLQAAFAAGVALALAVGIAVALREKGRRDAWPWLLLAGAIGCAAWLLPNASSGHDYLTDRLTPLAWIALVPVAAQAERRRRLQATACALLSLGIVGAGAASWIATSQELTDYDVVAAGVPPKAVVLALDFQAPGSEPRTRPFLHAGSRVALRAGAVDAGNYEPHTDHFPLRMRERVHWPHPLQVELAPGTVNLREVRFPAITHVVTRDLDQHAARYRGHLEQRYRELARSGRVVLFVLRN